MTIRWLNAYLLHILDNIHVSMARTTNNTRDTIIRTFFITSTYKKWYNKILQIHLPNDDYGYIIHYWDGNPPKIISFGNYRITGINGIG